MSYKHNQRQHAVKRFEERYDITLTKKLRKELLNRIRNEYNDQGVSVLEKVGHRLVMIIEQNSIRYKVVYDKKTNEIVTALPIKAAMVQR
ncbi:MAG: hypothetical protein HOG49_12870 [Candidatus Scalindua sp.]|nr:hypothetical protein [Candidatus Scalindua sp.]